MTVFQKQCLLGYMGYLPPKQQDGIDGNMTRTAESKFQSDFGYGVEALGTAVAQAIANLQVDEKTNDKQTETRDNWWDNIKYFKREEFKCKCGGKYCNGYPAEMCETVVRIADAAREHFKRPAYVISGLRDPQWNEHEGGVANSQHCSGEAIDLRIDGVDSETLRQFVSQQPGHRYSYCINGTNVHFDVPRGSK